MGSRGKNWLEKAQGTSIGYMALHLDFLSISLACKTSQRQLRVRCKKHVQMPPVGGTVDDMEGWILEHCASQITSPPTGKVKGSTASVIWGLQPLRFLSNFSHQP